MKCFTLEAKHFPVQRGGLAGYTSAFTDAYPIPTLGFELDRSISFVQLNYATKVKVSDQLLKQRPDPNFIERKGNKVVIYRASVKASTDGSPILIPEQPGDQNEALLLLNIGPGRHLKVRYEAAAEMIVAKASREDDWGKMNDDILILRMKAFDEVIAIRSSHKRLLWGAEVERERLRVSFDGENIFYNVVTTAS